MKINFLGTAAAEGWPALFCECEYCQRARKLGGKNIRKRTSTLVDQNILIDFGPDMLTHAQSHNIRLIKLDAIIITHSHEDHFYREELRISTKPYAHYDCGSRLDVFGNSTVKEIFDSKTKNNKLLSFTKVKPFEPFLAGEYTIHPLAALHGAESEESLIYAIEKDGKVFLNGNDTNYFPEETWEYIEIMKFNAVALDTTLGNGPGDELGKRGHMNIEAVFKVKERMIQTGCADEATLFIMNHFSHNGGLLYHELEETGTREGFIVAYDGMTITI